ncbi:twin-arginine translocation signal domain-containing protein [Streptomyces sp. NPDC033538]
MFALARGSGAGPGASRRTFIATTTAVGAAAAGSEPWAAGPLICL